MLPKPILVLGAHGQIGRSICEILGKKAIALSSDQADLEQPGKLASIISDYNPKMIINAAACTSVDTIENQESAAHLVNADSPKVLAATAKLAGIPFVHFSTDYVYSGEGDSPWHETDETNPLNAYGRTKLAGDLAIEEVGGKFLIFRTSWIYHEVGKNFVNTMLRLGREKEVLSIVDDQIGSPSYAADIAEFAIKATEHALAMDVFPSGVYHICNKGETSWYNFAEKIFSLADAKKIPLTIKDIKQIKTREYKTAAQRPLNSRLDCSKLRDTFGLELPTWENALERCMKNYPQLATRNS